MNDMSREAAIAARRKLIVDHVKTELAEIDHPAAEAILEEVFEFLDAIKLLAKRSAGIF